MNSFIHRAKDIFNKQLLTLVLACAMLISAAPMQAMAVEEQPKRAAETPVTANNVQNGGFESGDLTGWTVLTEGFNAASAVVNERTYWAQELPYNQSGDYHLNGWNTGIPEAEGWAVRSSTFVLGGSGFISVKMGGNAAVAKVFLADGTQVGYYRNFRFHDTNFPYISKGGSWCDMATYVIDLSDYLGKEMYIELHDEVITDGWANAFFDDVVTYYETAPDASKRFDKAPDGHNPGESPRLTYIPWVSVPKVSSEYANQIPNGDFETGDLSGWTVFGSGFPIKNGLPAADSSTTYWNQELPFNKSGNYFINGSALSGNEASTWRIRSTPFTLSGSGWISVKMGGHAAAVRVYKLDGTLVGDFDQSRFCDKDFPYLSKDGSWNDMATYLLDLTQNIGDVLYIELCDDPIAGGWANAFFDDVVTYYETVPTGKTETVNDGHQPGEKPKTVKIEPVVGRNNLYNPRNSGFEMGNLTGWTLVEGEMKLNVAVLAVGKSYNLDTEEELRKLPYNISGNFIISGHDATWEESDTWTLRSTPFTLAGSGYISVKMGGAAASFRVRTVKDNKLIAYCDQRRFHDDSSIFPYLSKGGSWRDMAVYVMDLSDYLGETLVIELLDQAVNTGWANSYFDDVIAYYPQRPTTKSDIVIDGYKEGIDEPKEIEIPWIYIDEFEDFRGQWPTTAVLTGFTSNEKADKTTTIYPNGDESKGEEVEYKTVNLYEYFRPNEGPDYQLEEGKLTITKVMYCDLDGKVTGLIADYSKLKARPGCYSVEYKFEQVGKPQTGRYTVIVEPEGGIKTSSKIFNGGFETGDLAGWEVVEGSAFDNSCVVSTDQRYWEGRSVYGWGDYYIQSKEGETGTIRSSTFTLGGDGYISFMIGCGKHDAYVALCDAETDEELISVTNTGFNDPDRALTLLRTYMHAPSDKLGKEVYLKAVDNATGDFGLLCLDDIRVSLTEEEVRELEEEQLAKIENETYTSSDDKYKNDLTNLQKYYKDYKDYPVPPRVLSITKYAKNQVVDCGTVDLTEFIKGVTATYDGKPVTNVRITEVTFNGKKSTSGFTAFDMSEPGYYYVTYAVTSDGRTAKATFTVTARENHNFVVNGDFETGDLTGWEVVGDGFNVNDAVVSAKTYWDGKLPYNQEGDYHLNGWETGIAEALSWTVRSTTFTLGDSGWISVRMGGRAAAVKVYEADGGTLVGYFKQTKNVDPPGAYPNVQNGHWADMTTYVMDLSDCLGDELYIELCDEIVDGSWAHAFFDDVKVWDTVPDWRNEKDTVANAIGQTPAEVDLPWIKAENLVGKITPAQTTIANGGFESDLDGWTLVYGNFYGRTPVISKDTYWAEELPYNQKDSKHLGGIEDHTGIPEAESWAVRSSVFKLDGSGYISARMGGNAAALKVYKANGELIKYYKANRFDDGKNVDGSDKFPHVANGGSWADMATYVMDLTKYKGEELYIVLCDEGAGVWAYACFDEVVTYYASPLDWAAQMDTVTDGHRGDESPSLADIPWQLTWEGVARPGVPATQAGEIEVQSVAEYAEDDTEEAPVTETPTESKPSNEDEDKPDFGDEDGDKPDSGDEDGDKPDPSDEGGDKPDSSDEGGDKPDPSDEGGDKPNPSDGDGDKPDPDDGDVGETNPDGGDGDGGVIESGDGEDDNPEPESEESVQDEAENNEQ